jgi:hypothetical protein
MAVLVEWLGVQPRADGDSALRRRSRRAEKRLRARRRSMARLPLSSRARCAARFEVLSLEATLRAYGAVAADRTSAAAQHYADASWFAQEARRLACWDEVG